jgi:hypothetical protein
VMCDRLELHWGLRAALLQLAVCTRYTHPVEDITRRSRRNVTSSACCHSTALHCGPAAPTLMQPCCRRRRMCVHACVLTPQVGGGTKTRRPVALRMQYNPDCDQPRCYLTLENGREEPR